MVNLNIILIKKSFFLVMIGTFHEDKVRLLLKQVIFGFASFSFFPSCTESLLIFTFF